MSMFVPTCQILQFHTETLTGVRHIPCPDGLNTTSQSDVLGATSGSGKASRNHILRTRLGDEELLIAEVQLMDHQAVTASQ